MVNIYSLPQVFHALIAEPNFLMSMFLSCRHVIAEREHIDAMVTLHIKLDVVARYKEIRSV